MNTEEFRCFYCQKKLAEGNLALLVQQKRQDPDEVPYIEILCRGCKRLNRFTYDPNNYVQKAAA